MNFDPTVPNPMFGVFRVHRVYRELPGVHRQRTRSAGIRRRFRRGLAWHTRCVPARCFACTGQVLRRRQDHRREHSLPRPDSEQHLRANSRFPPYTYWNIDEGLPAWSRLLSAVRPRTRAATRISGRVRIPAVRRSSTAGTPTSSSSCRKTWCLDRLHRHKRHTPLLGHPQLNQMDPKYFSQYGRDLLNSAVNSPAALRGGIQFPMRVHGTVARRCRPFRTMAQWRPTTPRSANAPATLPITP